MTVPYYQKARGILDGDIQLTTLDLGSKKLGIQIDNGGDADPLEVTVKRNSDKIFNFDRDPFNKNK